VRVGGTQHTDIGFDVTNDLLFVNRTDSGNFDWGTYDAGYDSLKLSDLKTDCPSPNIDILVDRASVEAIFCDGLYAFTELIFPDLTSNGIQVFGENAVVSQIVVTELQKTMGVDENGQFLTVISKAANLTRFKNFDWWKFGSKLVTTNVS
jgi:sucrose-6-phosphate hydrolase SacC (GH32 family)